MGTADILHLFVVTQVAVHSAEVVDDEIGPLRAALGFGGGTFAAECAAGAGTGGEEEAAEKEGGYGFRGSHEGFLQNGAVAGQVETQGGRWMVRAWVAKRDGLVVRSSKVEGYESVAEVIDLGEGVVWAFGPASLRLATALARFSTLHPSFLLDTGSHGMGVPPDTFSQAHIARFGQRLLGLRAPLFETIGNGKRGRRRRGEIDLRGSSDI